MDQEQAKEFGKWIEGKRLAAGLSMRETAKLAGFDNSYLLRLEAGRYLAPRPDSLVGLARALDVPLADIFAAADYVLPSELPSYVPYLRTKFRDAPQPAIDELQKQLARIARKYNFDATGPSAGEDEQPEPSNQDQGKGGQHAPSKRRKRG